MLIKIQAILAKAKMSLLQFQKFELFRLYLFLVLMLYICFEICKNILILNGNIVEMNVVIANSSAI